MNLIVFLGACLLALVVCSILQIMALIRIDIQLVEIRVRMKEKNG